MTYLVLVAVTLLGGQQAHGQLIWAGRAWMSMDGLCAVAKLCAPAPLDDCP